MLDNYRPAWMTDDAARHLLREIPRQDRDAQHGGGTGTWTLTVEGSARTRRTIPFVTSLARASASSLAVVNMSAFPGEHRHGSDAFPDLGSFDREGVDYARTLSVLRWKSSRGIPPYDLGGQQRYADCERQQAYQCFPRPVCRSAVCDGQPAQERQPKTDNLL